MKYRRDIDGLRAVAVLPVVLFHGQVPGMQGGFVGVDVFFVISGYLICSIIVDELSRNSFSIIDFYERRCRRILPALFFMGIVTTALAALVLLPPDMKKYFQSLLATTFFVSNIYFWRSSGYFDTASEYKPLLHTWSLGVEEQFYFFMPLILFFIWRWMKGRYVFWLIPISAFSFLTSVWGLTNAPTATFYILPTRYWELSVGAIIAISAVGSSMSRKSSNLLGLLGLSAIAWSITTLSDQSPFPAWNALLPCFGAAAILCAGENADQPISSRILNTSALVFVGGISYSLYLWHWPLLALAKYWLLRELTAIETFSVLLIGFVAAVGSWRYIEMPFRRQSETRTKRFVFSRAGIAMVLTVLISAIGIYSNGLSVRYPNFRMEAISGKERYKTGTCFLEENQPPSDWHADRCYLTNGGGPTVALWGDSFAAQYVPGILDYANISKVNIIQYTASACPPILGYKTAIRPNCQAFNDEFVRMVKQYNVSVVVMSARWESLFKRGVTPGAVADTVRRLGELGLKVYVLGQSPIYTNDVQVIFAKNGNTSKVQTAKAPLSFSRNVNLKLKDALPPGLFIDPLSTFCTATFCDYRRDGKFLVIDDGHFSSYGSRIAVAGYFPLLTELPN